jgi:hypothetical protein
MEPIAYPETSVTNYHYSLRNNPEERSPESSRGGRLQSRIHYIVFKKKCILEQTVNTKYLGVQIDNHISFKKPYWPHDSYVKWSMLCR